MVQRHTPGSPVVTEDNLVKDLGSTKNCSQTGYTMKESVGVENGERCGNERKTSWRMGLR